ncbi:uncharacterized protein LOC129944528 [Eupeodes corollae]|uniref:uncharacterized protein LOC129944528 n=1 Tax=Eupeodes corollae TaxID=290404 RepID=UPI00248FE0D8|nr:uncharacterized protein LOC129944528 [Eupeodes corollae]
MKPFVIRSPVAAILTNYDRKFLNGVTRDWNKSLKWHGFLKRWHSNRKCLENAIVDNVSSIMADQAKGESVCKIDVRPKFTGYRRLNLNKSFSYSIICGRCGSKGHKASDASCPAKGKTCHACGLKDHFSRCCFRRESASQNSFTGKRRNSKPDIEQANNKLKRENVQMVDTGSKLGCKNIEDEYDDIFCIDSNEKENSDIFSIDSNDEGNKIWCTIGGIEIELIVDSGVRYNVIDKLSWLDLNAKNIVIVHKQKEVDIDFRAYGGYPLKFIGMFTAVIKAGKSESLAKFYVANELGKVLLGYETGYALGVLKIGVNLGSQVSGVNVNAINSNEIECESVGKIRVVMVDIPIRSDVKPVAQPYRRVPVALEKLVDERIDKMLREGIIEQVNGVAKWVSPLVIAPKGKDDVRICVDMRRANLAVERENHPLPTMDDFLPHLCEAKWFSKLDVKQAYHQV